MRLVLTAPSSSSPASLLIVPKPVLTPTQTSGIRPMAEIKLDYVNTFYDARGKLRHQFRRRGHKRVTIKGRPGSQEFMDAYHVLLGKTGGPLSVADIGASHTKAGTIDALIAKYRKHDDFTKGLSKA